MNIFKSKQVKKSCPPFARPMPISFFCLVQCPWIWYFYLEGGVLTLRELGWGRSAIRCRWWSGHLLCLASSCLAIVVRWLLLKETRSHSTGCSVQLCIYLTLKTFSFWLNLFHRIKVQTITKLVNTRKNYSNFSKVPPFQIIFEQILV